MAVTLTPGEVETFTGATVTDTDIETAERLIRRRTGLTPTQHEEDRQINADDVKQAWSIAATRHRAKMAGSSGTSGIISESQGDYSYSVDPVQARTDINGPVVNAQVLDLLDIIHPDTFTYNTGGILTWS